MARPLDLYVRRLPPTAAHFRSQRVRQAYDDFALPARMALWLALAPAATVLLARRQAAPMLGAAALSVSLAELGRRRAGGRGRFPASASLFAPLWLAERALTSWLAVWSRLARGGVRYGDMVIERAGSSPAELRRRHGA